MKLYFSFLIILFSFQSNAQLNISWANSIGGSDLDRDQTNAIIELDDQNILTAGRFLGAADFDPGPGVYNLNNGNGFIQKLDTSGALIWVKELDGDCFIQDLAQDASGNIIVVGQYKDTLDFDPSPAVNNEISQNYTGFILKLNSLGDFVWVESLDHIDADTAYAEVRSVTTIDDDIYIAGSFSDSIDFNPGAGTEALWGDIDIYVLKLNSSGAFVWVHQIVATHDDYAYGIEAFESGDLYLAGTLIVPMDTVDIDPDPLGEALIYDGGRFIQKLDSSGNHLALFIDQDQAGFSGVSTITEGINGEWYATGSCGGTFDLDPGPNEWIETQFVESIYVQKFDASDNLEWAVVIPNDSSSWVTIDTDQNGDVYISNSFYDTIDLDPSTYGVSQWVSSLDRSSYISKFSREGEFIYGEKLNVKGSFYLTVVSSNDIYIGAAYKNTIDFDPSVGVLNLTSTGDYDAFVTKYNVDPCADMYAILDSVSSGSCSGNGYTEGHATMGTPPYTYSWNTIPATPGNIATPDVHGIYTLSVVDANGCTADVSALVNLPVSPSGFDLNTNLVATSFQIGAQVTTWIDAYNAGCLNSPGELTMILDTAELAFASSTITPASISINGDTITWTYGPGNFDSPHLQPQVILDINSSISTWDSVGVDLKFTPITGDLNPINNEKQYSFPVINAYDPNDKQAYPIGECPQHYILDDQTLTYTVRFQNTGNANAINIEVLDSINDLLDLSSLRIVGQSHPNLVTEILPNNWVSFQFDSILLPAEMQNAPLSHGFVIFEIDLPDGIPSGSELNNRAEIYFDINPPIFTNTVMHTVVDLVDCSLSVETLEPIGNIKVYPNPTSNILNIESTDNSILNTVLYDLQGSVVNPFKLDSSTLDLNALPDGIYILKVYTEAGVSTHKILKD